MSITQSLSRYLVVEAGGGLRTWLVVRGPWFVVSGRWFELSAVTGLSG